MITGLIPGIASILVTWLTGYFLIAALVRGRSYLLASLGWLFGSGITSLSMLAIYLCGGNLRPWFQVVQGVLLLVSVALRYRVKPALDLNPVGVDVSRWSWIGYLLAFLLVALTASVFMHGITTPALRFDEVHNWGFKALSTAHHGEPFKDKWRYMLFPNNIPFLGASVHVSLAEPRETLTHLVPFLFLVSLLGCCHHAAVSLSGRAHWGLPLTVMLLLGSPLLMIESDRLTCDLPLAALTMGAVVFALHWLGSGRSLAAALCGIACGLCMWTKTEGLMLAAGIAGGIAVGALFDAHRRRHVIRDGLIWLACVLAVIGPWHLFLWTRGLGMGSSGHVGSLQLGRWEVILPSLWKIATVDNFIPTVAFLAFLLLSVLYGKRSIKVFLMLFIGAGIIHAVLPCFLVPREAFGGWRNFTRVGIPRYVLHFVPVMLVSIAAMADSRVLGPLDRAFKLTVRRKKR
jgi:hypothetical protein